jgi:hypothetical protein
MAVPGIMEGPDFIPEVSGSAFGVGLKPGGRFVFGVAALIFLEDIPQPNQ